MIDRRKEKNLQVEILPPAGSHESFITPRGADAAWQEVPDSEPAHSDNLYRRDIKADY